jgi:hypothetical protein
MTAHDPCCCLDDMPSAECPVCASILMARAEEKERFNATWKANLPGIERRNYLQGWTDAVNGRRLGP